MMLKNTPPKHSTKNIKPPFEERVYAEKKKSLPVLLNMIDSPIIGMLNENRDTIKSHLQKVHLNYYNIVSLCRDLKIPGGMNFSGLTFGDVSFKKKSEIIDNIARMGPFNSQGELIEKIAKYIKDNMGYSMFDFLDQVNLVSASLIDSSQADLPQKEKILRIMDEWFSTTLGDYDTNSINTTKLVDNVISFLTENGIKSTSKEILDLNKEIGGKKDIQSAIHVMRNFIHMKIGNGIMINMDQLSTLLSQIKSSSRCQQFIHANKNIHSLIAKLTFYYNKKNYSEIKKLNNDPLMYQFLLEIKEILGSKFPINTSIDKKEVSEYLNTIRSGVCRHFSAIAKLIYEEMKSQILNKNESEVLYVVNPSKQHAYNILMTEGSDGKIYKRYFDLTDYIGGGKLWQPIDKKIYGNKDHEFLVENTRKTKKYQDININQIS